MEVLWPEEPVSRAEHAICQVQGFQDKQVGVDASKMKCPHVLVLPER